MSRLARENAVRNPGRTGSTAAALMIGLVLVTAVATLGHGLRSSAEHAAAQQVHARYVVLPREHGGTFTKALKGGSSVRWENNVTGIDAATIGRFYTFHHLRGALGGAMVTSKYADQHHLRLGSTVYGTAVTGIYEPPAMDPLLGDVALPQAAFDRLHPHAKNAYTFSDTRLDVSAYPDAKLASEHEFYVSRGSGLKTLLAMVYVLLAFSVLVSLFGMVNTLVLAVHERTRELGMLRAVGMTRRQARRMIRQESVITALIGAALGIPLGIGVAAGVTALLAQYGVALALPWLELAVFTAVAIVAGVLAAIVPARRASRIDVLAALQYE